IDFVDQHGDDGQAIPITLNGITTDYAPDVFYAGETVSSVILPLNDQADMTRFTFDLEAGPIDVEVAYTRPPVVFHNTCASMAISGLSIVASEFLSESEVLSYEITFPVNPAIFAIIPV